MTGEGVERAHSLAQKLPRVMPMLEQRAFKEIAGGQL
jgi:hypothetical protein